MSAQINDLSLKSATATAVPPNSTVNIKAVNEKTKVDTISTASETVSTALIFSHFTASAFAENNNISCSYIYPSNFISIKAITEAIMTKKGSWKGGWSISAPNISASDTEMKRFNQLYSAIRASTNFKDELSEVIKRDDLALFNYKGGYKIIVELRGGFCFVIVEDEKGLTPLTISIVNNQVEIIENPKPMVVDVDTLKVIPALEARIEVQSRVAQAKALKTKELRKVSTDLQAKAEFDKICAMIENAKNYSKELSELTPDIHKILRKENCLRTKEEVDILAKYNADELFASAKNGTIVYKHMQSRDPIDTNIYSRIYKREMSGIKFTMESPKTQYYHDSHLAIYIFEEYDIFGGIDGDADRIISEIHVSIGKSVVIYQKNRCGDLEPIPNSTITVNNGILTLSNGALKIDDAELRNGSDCTIM